MPRKDQIMGDALACFPYKGWVKIYQHEGLLIFRKGNRILYANESAPRWERKCWRRIRTAIDRRSS